MTKQIKWKFKDTDVYFVNSEANMGKHVYKQANRMGICPAKIKIEIIDDNFITDTSPDGCASCKRNSAVDTQPALSVVSDQTEPQPEADELLGMFFDVDPTGTAADLLSDSPSTSDADSTSDGVAGEPA